MKALSQRQMQGLKSVSLVPIWQRKASYVCDEPSEEKKIYISRFRVFFRLSRHLDTKFGETPKFMTSEDRVKS